MTSIATHERVSFLIFVQKASCKQAFSRYCSEKRDGLVAGGIFRDDDGLADRMGDHPSVGIVISRSI